VNAMLGRCPTGRLAPCQSWRRVDALTRVNRARRFGPNNRPTIIELRQPLDFELSPLATDLRQRLQRFMDDLVVPSLPEWQRYADAGVYPLDIIEPLKQQARSLGLWNLFLPGLSDDQPGTRLSLLIPVKPCIV
jgi:hypothetical protein